MNLQHDKDKQSNNCQKILATRRFLLAAGTIVFTFCISTPSFSQSTNNESAKLEQKYNEIIFNLTASDKSEKDSLEASKNMLTLAEQGYNPAMRFVGTYYYNKKGFDQYEHWYVKAAENGDTLAQFELGKNYYEGTGLSKDYAKAVFWYTKAAELGHAKAQNNLGICYVNGQGVEQDYTKAAKWYTKAAEQGYSNAQYNLAICYANGQGVEQDYTKAAKWYEKAAEQGLADAQYNLGVCYANGHGVEQDYAKAVFWLEKAAGQGNADAQDMLHILKSMK